MSRPLRLAVKDAGIQPGCCGDSVVTTPHMDRLAREATQDPLLDPAALQALVAKEKDAPPTPVPAWKKARNTATEPVGKEPRP